MLYVVNSSFQKWQKKLNSKDSVRINSTCRNDVSESFITVLAFAGEEHRACSLGKHIGEAEINLL